MAEDREGLRLNPHDDEARLGFGVALETKGDVEGAIAEYREGLRLNPNNFKAHYDLGSALRREGDYNGAIAEDREALRLNPGYAQARVNLGAAPLPSDFQCPRRSRAQFFRENGQFDRYVVRFRLEVHRRRGPQQRH